MCFRGSVLPSVHRCVGASAHSGVEQRGGSGLEAHPVRRPRARSREGHAGGEGGRRHGEAAVERARARWEERRDEKRREEKRREDKRTNRGGSRTETRTNSRRERTRGVSVTHVYARLAKGNQGNLQQSTKSLAFVTPTPRKSNSAACLFLVQEGSSYLVQEGSRRLFFSLAASRCTMDDARCT